MVLSGFLQAYATTPERIVAGSFHTCALTTTGGVGCWGDNSYGQLGKDANISGTPGNGVPTPVLGLSSGVSSITAGTRHTCALTTTGGVKCWGENDSGQLGDGTTTNRGAPVDVAGLGTGVKDIKASDRATCALIDDGTVKCWGLLNSNYGKSPYTISGLENIKAIAVGEKHACAITSANTVKCWGDNGTGALGNGTTTDSNTPIDVNLSNVASITTGGSFYIASTCAITTDNSVYCWGYSVEKTPTLIENNPDKSILFKQKSEGMGGCAITQYGDVRCWSKENFLSQKIYGLDDKPIDIALGFSHTCVLDANGTAKCWGNNSYNTLGDISIIGSSTSTPVSVKGSDGIELNFGVASPITTATHPTNISPTVSASYSSNFAVNNKGQLLGWGDTQTGNTFLGTSSSSHEYPILIMSDVKDVSAGLDVILALRTDNSLWAWGIYSGRDTRPTPNSTNRRLYYPVKIMDNVIKISAGRYHALALKSDGTVWAWGKNSDGEIGNNTTTKQITPVQVLSDVKEIAAGYNISFAIKNDGTLWGWGDGQHGRLDSDALIPVKQQLAETFYFSKVSADATHVLALDGTGKVWAWGDNSDGQLGTNNTTDSSVPVHIMDSVTDIQVFGSSSFALKSDGSLFVWGDNYYGQLGTGNKNTFNSPVQFVSSQDMSSIVKIATGMKHTISVDAAGNVWSWGDEELYPVSIRTVNGDILNLGTETDPEVDPEVDPAGTTVSFFLRNKGTSVLPQTRDIPLSFQNGIASQSCSHGEVYELYMRMEFSQYLIHIDDVAGRVRKTRFDDKLVYRYEPQEEVTAVNLEGTSHLNTVKIADNVICSHHATDGRPVGIDFRLSTHYRIGEDSLLGFNTIRTDALDTSGIVKFVPTESLQDILKRTPVFSKEFSPNNAIIAAALSELAYYPESYVKDVLVKAGFYEPMFYEYTSVGVDAQLYIAYKWPNDNYEAPPIIYIFARGTAEGTDIFTDALSAGYASLPVNLERLGFYSSFLGADHLNPFARGFYQFADFGVRAFVTYSNPLQSPDTPIYALPTKYVQYPLDGKAKVFIAGHSLGGAVANIMTVLLSTEIDTDNMQTYTIGAPRSIGGYSTSDGNLFNLAKIVNNSDYNMFTIRHSTDVVPKVPPHSLLGTSYGYDHVGNLIGLYGYPSYRLIQHQTDDDVGSVGTVALYEFVNRISDIGELLLGSDLSAPDSFSTHSSNFYINTLSALEKTTEGHSLEIIANNNSIYDRGTCIENRPCYIHAKLTGKPGGIIIENILGENMQPSYQLLKNLGVGFVVTQTAQGSPPDNIYISDEPGTYENVVKRCRIYANGNFTCFNPVIDGTPTNHDFYFKLDTTNASPMYYLDKVQESIGDFHMLGVHQQ